MWDEAYENMAKELYPEHKEQAIAEFTSERLRSFYLKNPDTAVNAVRSIKEAKSLLNHGHPSASYVFSVSAIEQFLKAAVLKPVVYGLVHADALAGLIVDLTVCQPGLDRYKKLLAGLFDSLVSVDINNAIRSGSQKKLLEEVADVQNFRNRIIHQGFEVQEQDAEYALNVALGIYSLILVQMLDAIGLSILKGGKIIPATYER